MIMTAILDLDLSIPLWVEAACQISAQMNLMGFHLLHAQLLLPETLYQATPFLVMAQLFN